MLEIKARRQWGHQAESTISLVGYAVGLGNFCRFPYLCMRNGGGAFLIPYLTFMLLCGLPLYYLELSMAQFSGLSALKIWEICPIFEGVGWGMLIVSAIYCMYYTTFMSWGLYYICMSLRAEVPWKTCQHAWNTPDCITLGNQDNGTGNGTTLTPNMTVNVTLSAMNDRTAAGQFWNYKVLDISSGIDELGVVRWELLLCQAVIWIIILLCLIKGVKSLGKIVYLTVPLPYILLTILLIRGLTLPGSLEGIRYYIIPEWSRLTNFKVWTEASVQVFYSLAVAWGGTTTMASYNKFNNNCLRDAVVTVVSCACTSFYAGFAIFSVIGYMAHTAGLDMENIVTQGPGLAFVAYPEGLATMPIAPFWSVIFFLTLISLGIDSEFTTLEVVTTGLIDKYARFLNDKKTRMLLVTVIIMFTIGLVFITQGGMYWFQVVDWYMAAISVMLFSFIECFVVCYVYGIGRFCRDMQLMYNKTTSYFWIVCWGGISPCLILLMLMSNFVHLTAPTYGDYVYPVWAEAFGWIIAMVSVVPIPVLAIYKLVTWKGTLIQRISNLLSPTTLWRAQDASLADDHKVQGSSWRENMIITFHPLPESKPICYGNGSDYALLPTDVKIS